MSCKNDPIVDNHWNCFTLRGSWAADVPSLENWKTLIWIVFSRLDNDPTNEEKEAVATGGISNHSVGGQRENWVGLPDAYQYQYCIGSVSLPACSRTDWTLDGSEPKGIFHFGWTLSRRSAGFIWGKRAKRVMRVSCLLPTGHVWTVNWDLK